MFLVRLEHLKPLHPSRGVGDISKNEVKKWNLVFSTIISIEISRKYTIFVERHIVTIFECLQKLLGIVSRVLF